MSAVLAIDTSTDACSVAFATSAKVIASHRIIPRAHNRHVFSMIDEVLEEVGLDRVDIFACGVGPGSFTGLRVAVGVVQGLAWSLCRPVVTACSLTLQAWSAQSVKDIKKNQEARWLLSATDAQIGQVYWRLFEKQGEALLPVTQPTMTKPGDIDLREQIDNERGGLVVLGSGAALKSQFSIALQAQVCQWLPDVRPHAADFAERVVSQPQAFASIVPQQLKPHYVQQDIGWKKLSEQPRRD